MFSKSEKAKKGGKQAGVSADNVAALPKIQDEAADANLLDSIFDDMDKDADLQVKREQKRQKTINERWVEVDGRMDGVSLFQDSLTLFSSSYIAS